MKRIGHLEPVSGEGLYLTICFATDSDGRLALFTVIELFHFQICWWGK
jgi:hypothetical protein